MDAGGVLRQVGLVPENPEVPHQEPESHQRDAGANPGEKGSRFGEIIPQVSTWLFFGRGIHFGLTPLGRHAHRWPSRPRRCMRMPAAQNSSCPYLTHILRPLRDHLVSIAVFGALYR